MNSDPIEQLAVMDPHLAADIAARLAQKPVTIQGKDLAGLVAETLWGLSQEISFGRAVAHGVADLAGEVSAERLQHYRELVRHAGKKGPTLGRIMATYLVPVLKHGDDRLLEHFLKTIEIMRQKGTYTLTDPLETLTWLLNSKDPESAARFLDLLSETFSQDLSYNRCQHFTREIPRAVRNMAPDKRGWQIFQLERIIRQDFKLAESFLDGMPRGLAILSKAALDRFVSKALEKNRYNKKLGRKFMALESRLGADTFAGMQVTVPLSQVRTRLNRYVRARIGRPVSIRPLSSLPKLFSDGSGHGPVVCSDGRFIYLPDEIDRFDRKADNIGLYKILTRMEAGLFEFGTFDFDLERALERHPDILDFGPGGVSLKPDHSNDEGIPNQKDLSDLAYFFSLFPHSDLAADLFTVFEHGRLRIRMAQKYPGLLKAALPVLQQEAARLLPESRPVHPVAVLYRRIALGMPASAKWALNGKQAATLEAIVDHFEDAVGPDTPVETCAVLTAKSYAAVAVLLENLPAGRPLADTHGSMATPFGRRIRPDLVFSSFRSYHRMAAKIKESLAARDIRVFRSDIIRCLIKNQGRVSEDDLLELIQRCRWESDTPPLTHSGDRPDLSGIDLSALFDQAIIHQASANRVTGKVFWYREWDNRLGDYLPDHVRVADRRHPGCGNGFYGKTLEKHGGLVKKIRYAFERLKPEGLLLLRRWIEGDELDYRALLDFAIDKKTGRTPSERLYNKRVKQIRDVAVLLLMDLSRSTAHTAAGGRESVLEIEKEAVVLFCEALQVVEDSFAIAGFSGTGRLGVDYFRIKDFSEPVGETVRDRIGALSPRRNTRMGDAIRHAAAQLERVSAKIRLLLILGDGFPNDTDYKRERAVEDTRKAILEAASRNIHTHAITVNLGVDARLDDLYGNARHSVISDVRDLPDRLPRIYGTLTKN